MNLHVDNTLTHKEKFACHLAAKGLRMKQVANVLNTSEAYTKKIFHGIYNKTGVDNKLALVILVMEHPEHFRIEE